MKKFNQAKFDAAINTLAEELAVKKAWDKRYSKKRWESTNYASIAYNALNRCMNEAEYSSAAGCERFKLSTRTGR